MKITIEFLSLPKVTRIVGGKSITLDFNGRTIRDLLTAIAHTYGEEVRDFLFDKSGNLETVFKVMRNKNEWIHRDRLDTRLKDGDLIMIMMLVGGG